MQRNRNPETLRIFFSGPKAKKILEDSRLTVHESKIIEAAIASARSPNPDPTLLREAEILVGSLEAGPPGRGPETQRNASPHPVTHVSEIGHLSSYQFYAERDPAGNPDTFLGYLYWRYKLDNIYGPIVILLLLLAAGWYFGGPGNDRLGGLLGLTATKYPMARYRCRNEGKTLPPDGEAVMRRLSEVVEGRDRLGYWLADGTVYYPLTDQRKKADERVHLYFCIDRPSE